MLLGLSVQTLLADEFPAGKAVHYSARTDNQVAAMELRTGKVIWKYKPKKLGDAHFEVRSKGLIVYPHNRSDKKTNPVFLDLKTGKSIDPLQDDSQGSIARSTVLWPPPQIQLDNGWQLVGFSPGNTTTFRFHDPKATPSILPKVALPKLDPKLDPKIARGPAEVNAAWTIATSGHPHEIVSWKNMVMYAFDYLSDEGVVYAHRAGDDKPVWKVDLNTIVRDRAKPLTRMRLQVIGDTLYVQASEHIFAFAPESGRLHWHRDLCSDLDLGGFRPDLCRVSNKAVFVVDDNVLVISFECRTIAIDLTKKKYLWHFEPDTYPHTPLPVVHEGKLFLTCGAKNRLHSR
jgi:hypothetical protein